MNEVFVFWGLIACLTTAVLLCLIFRKPITGLINRSKELDLDVSKEGVKASFRADLEAFERDSSATAKAAEASNPAPVAPTASQQVLPENTERTDPDSVEGPVSVGDMLAIGADWGGLIREAKQLLDDNDIPTPSDHSSLGILLRAFDDDRPGILPERAEDVAANADRLLQKLMAVGPGDVNHEDLHLFSSALASLHTIISKAASKARHPSRAFRPGAR